MKVWILGAIQELISRWAIVGAFLSRLASAKLNNLLKKKTSPKIIITSFRFTAVTTSNLISF